MYDINDIKTTDIATGLKQVKSIATRGKNLNNDIHVTACAGLIHFVAHGDLQVLSSLAKATATYTVNTGKFNANSLNGSALRTWIEAFVPVHWVNGANNGKGGYKKLKEEKLFEVDVEAAVDMPFYNYKDSNSDPYLDVLKSIADLKAKIDKSIKRTEDEKDGKQIKADDMVGAMFAVDALGELVAAITPPKATPKPELEIVVTDDDEASDTIAQQISATG